MLFTRELSTTSEGLGFLDGSSELAILGVAIDDLKRRAWRLRIQSSIFLVAVILLLFTGAVFFYLAPQLTISDIRTFNSLIEQKQAELSGLQQRQELLQQAFTQSKGKIADHLLETRTSISPVDLTPDLRAVFFVDEAHGFAVGSGGTILATRDGGASWQAQASGTQVVLMSVHFVSPELGFAVGDRRHDPGDAGWRGELAGAGERHAGSPLVGALCRARSWASRWGTKARSWRRGMAGRAGRRRRAARSFPLFGAFCEPLFGAFCEPGAGLRGGG